MASEKLDEKAIFNVARTIGSSEARAKYLRQACGSDAELIDRVHTLLHGYEEQVSFLESPAIGFAVGATIDRPASEGPGTVIGWYKLLQQIGEGGMGVVFMAEQAEPIQRTVALKIIRPGMDTQQVIARFEAERQALAMMDHPNIAKVLDAGTTDSGRPFFVMELVKGVPITKYCDDKQLSLRERLELFMPVCQAVQHAHQKGIIHRDIKPTNILVAEYDNHAVPKVIDFGVAKATAQRLTERTMFTEFGQIVGTVEYMSPEQAKFNQLDIDTRSDIYSLGVLLYELLAGSTPFERSRLREAAFDEALRIIREEEPPKPSTRLSSSDTLPAIAARRHVEPQQLTSAIRGELDWIVMRTLEKDRQRRYQTASALVADVERYLNDELVEARPPTVMYGLRKFIRRNKAGVLAGSAIALAVVLGLILASIGFVQARYQSQIAEIQATRSDHVAEFLRDVLTTTGPSVARGRDASLLHEILDKTADRLNSDLKTEPEVQGDIWYTLGETYVGIGDDVRALTSYQYAVDCFRVALGNENTKLALALGKLGRCQSITGHIAIGLTNAQLGLQIARKCGDSETLAKCLLDIGTSFDHSQVISPEGEPYLRESVALWRQLGNKPLALAESLQALAVAIRDKNGVEAESLAREALSLHRQLLGPDDPKIVIDLSLIGGILAACNRVPEANAVLNEAVILSHRILEKDGPNQYLMLYALAQPLCRQGKWNEVDTMVRQAVEAYPSSAGYWGLLGNVSASQGNWTAAADQFTHAVELAPNYSVVVNRLAIASLQAGRREQYQRLRHEYVMKDFTNEAFRSEHVLLEVSAFLIQPADGADFERLCHLGDLAASPDDLPRNNYWKELLRVQTDFRRGNFEAASNLANRIVSRKDNEQFQRKPHAWFMRAMACARLNEMESAKAAFGRGDELVSRPNDGSHAVSLSGWPESALAELLRDQAAKLLGITDPPSPKPSTLNSKLQK